MSALVIVLVLLPLVGATVCGVLVKGGRDATARSAGFAVSLVELVLVAVIWGLFDPSAPTRFQGESSVEWIPAFGVSFALGLDGIALAMIALLAVLVPIVIAYTSFTRAAERFPDGPDGEPRGAGGFVALMLSLQGVLVALFAATDVFVFYVMFEVMLVPMYFIIGRFGGARRQYAAVKFFLYSFLGGLIMLGSVIGIYVASGTRLGAATFDWAELQRLAAQLPESTQIFLFLGFFAAFAIKAPLVPLHTWLPDAGAQAPIGGGVILVGVLDKVGVFGFLRYCLPLFPLASQTLAPLVLVLSVIGVLYGALLAAMQTDMKRFVSYTSIAHFGFIGLGIFAFSQQSVAGSALYMVNHGISTAMLFLVVGMLAARGGSTQIADYGGVGKIAPVLAGLFLVAGLTTLSLPGTNSFVSEFLVLLGSWPREPVYTVIATVGIIFAALYVLWVYQRTMTGPLRGEAVVGGGPGAATARALAGGPGFSDTVDTDPPDATRRARFGDLSGREIGVLAPLVLLIFLLGFFPQPVLDVINPAVSATMSEVGVADPVGPNGVAR
ncbi:NADH-quinone oxidoreductase subunit M [Actinomycetospora sp. NBRC 106378]|uniref:NADH-quinone oxidoreductase subunit M n=1 Tax=Actinomycetospora sp. NBRC 106378 TaxID=3032208 RepID=UPI0024A4D7A4|nr:NADH-quinone oxidoreductase subunit M [Actinomycetospora sp. NBRC 106378]GLZ50895.1 NADH-quinone oxidoreductase subunit M [Actinomycetospora sp. NBRC 106378]